MLIAGNALSETFFKLLEMHIRIMQGDRGTKQRVTVKIYQQSICRANYGAESRLIHSGCRLVNECRL